VFLGVRMVGKTSPCMERKTVPFPLLASVRIGAISIDIPVGTGIAFSKENDQIKQGKTPQLILEYNNAQIHTPKEETTANLT
jgi:hypothetical protein